MNGYDLTSKLRRTRRRYPLTATEQALYHELVAICNEDEWADTFSCSNQELCNALQITEKTLTVARLALIQAGILFYKSGQSKRQYGLYSFTKKLTPVKIPVDQTTNPTTDKGGDNTANVTTNPTANASDYNKTKLNKTKPNSNSSAEAQGEEKKEPAVHWKVLVDTWFMFYKQKFSREPTFNAAAAKNLKSILVRLEKQATQAKFEWSENNAREAFTHFLTNALQHSDWLSRNFLLGNIASQYDAIVNRDANGKAINQNGKAGPGAKVTGAQVNTSFAKFYQQGGPDPGLS